MLKLKTKDDEPNVYTLTQMVSTTHKKMDLKENNATRYMVSRKATTYHRTKMRCIIQQGQPTMTQTFTSVEQSLSVTPEPFVFTQLSSDYPTSPSASVIDLLSHASDELSKDLLPEGTIP